MIRRKKRYLYSDEPIPRRTEYRWRKAREALLRNQSASDSDSDAAACILAPVMDFGEAKRAHTTQPSGIAGNSSSDDSDECHGNGHCKSSDKVEKSSCCGYENPQCENRGEELVNNVSFNHHKLPDSDASSLTSPDRSSTASPTSPEFTSGQEEGNNSSIEEDSDSQRENENQGFRFENQNYNRDEHPRLLDNTLCACSTTTEGDVLLMCLALGIRHNLSWLAMVDILKMVNCIHGNEVIHASKYYLLKYMEKGKETRQFHIYCPSCEAHVETVSEVKNNDIFHCSCGQEITDFSTNSSYFASINLETQIKDLLQNPELAHEIMTYRFERVKSNRNALEDIYDGNIYKTLSTEGRILSDPLNFSYNYSTDGVQLGKASSRSVWPIFAYINELSPQNRKKNILLAGLWVGNREPNMRIFLKPFVQQANKLSTEGVTWINVNGEIQNSKVIPLVAVLDSGARYKFLNMSSYNAYYGCTFCYQKAENTEAGRRYTVPQVIAPLRTQHSMIEDMKEAFKNRNNMNEQSKVVRGCKGPSPLIEMHYSDISTSVLIDFLHNNLLGNARSHTSMFLSTCGARYYIGSPDKVFHIDSRLKSIKPPRSITRTPRALKETKIWKASEWRSWLLFYSLVCLNGILKPCYLEHMAMLSSAVFILIEKSVLPEQLLIAHKYLLQYVYLTQKYFGKTAMVYNIHLLTHVTKGVSDWGPLWTHDMFVFEGQNRHLIQMYSSPARVVQQLTRRFLTFHAFPTLCETYASSEAPTDFIQDITGKSLKSFLRCGESVLFGKGKTHTCSDEELACLLLAGINVNGDVFSHQKMLHNGIRFSTQEYASDKKNDDWYVTTKRFLKGRINHILNLWHEGKNIIVLILRLLVVDKVPFLQTQHVKVTHIKRVLHTGSLKAVCPTEIRNQCIYMDLDCGKYIADMPYGSYGD